MEETRKESAVKITVDYSAMLSLADTPRGATLDIDSPKTAGELLIELGVKKHHHRFIIFKVNDETVKASHPLSDGDDVFFLLLAGGG